MTLWCFLKEFTKPPLLRSGTLSHSVPEENFLFDGLVEGALALSEAGCKTLHLDGSYVTSKFNPGDYDVAWDPEEVNFKILDPMLAETRHPRASQKHKY